MSDYSAGGVAWMEAERPAAIKSAHDITREFERQVAEYCGAPYCVAVNSCTAALMLAVSWFTRPARESARPMVDVPKRTYVGVPMSVIHGGGWPAFTDEEWLGAYQLRPLPVWDSARWMTSGLFKYLDERTKCTAAKAMVCLSFHATKTLGIEQGGAILHADPQADQWFRRQRFDGRTPGVHPSMDTIAEIGWHCYMNPSTAAQGLMRMPGLPLHNAPLPNDNYPDLSTLEAFQ